MSATTVNANRRQRGRTGDTPSRRETTGVRRFGRSPRDLVQRLAGREELPNSRPRRSQNLAKKRIRRIPAGEPEDLRWRPEPGDQIHEITVLRQDDGGCGACTGENVGILRVAQPKLADRNRVDRQFVAHPACERGRQMRIQPDPHPLRREDGVSQSATGKAEAGRDVLALQVGELLDHLIRRQAHRQQIEDITDANAHAAHARTPPALVGIHGDAIHQFDRLAHQRCSG